MQKRREIPPPLTAAREKGTRGRMPIRTALLSVSDKTGLLPFAAALAKRGVHILSSGGTAKALAAEGIPVADGRELHRLARGHGRPREDAAPARPRRHPRARRRSTTRISRGSAARSIDLVVVNLYPFEKTVGRSRGRRTSDIIENIDIGGPSMVRSAAKNHARVTVVCDPRDYGRVLAEIEQYG